MTPAMLLDCVNAYGSTTALADALGTTYRTVRRWISGSSSMPELPDLPNVLWLRAIELRAQADECERMAEVVCRKLGWLKP